MLPLALAAFVAGCWVLQQQAELPPVVLIVAALALGGAAAAGALWAQARAVAGRGAALLAAAGALAAGFGYAGLLAQWRMADQLAFGDEGRDVRVTGVVASLPAALERGVRFEFEVEQVLGAADGTPQVPQRLSLGWYGADVRVRPAERWSFTVRLRRPHGAMNPGGFDLEAWMLERNLRATGYVREVVRPRAGQDGSDGGLPGAQADRRDATPQRLDARVLQPGPLVDRLRDDLRAELQARLAGSRYGGVIVALVLGDQRAIAEADWQLFNRTGISHLVSISGLHITMVAGLVALLAGWSWRRSARLLARAPAQTAAAVAGMLTALAYCLLAGWGVPAQRTFFMLAVVALALLSRLALRPTLTLAAAAFFVNLLDPWSALAPGFWLSFGAVAAILYALSSQAGPPQRGWRATLLAAAQVQLAVTVALVPLTVLLFQQVSLVSPLANAVAIPLVSLVVTPMALAGGLAVALPAPLDTLALPLLAIAHALFAWLADGLAWVAAWPWASVPLAAPPGWTLPLAFAGVAWLLAPPGWPARWVGVLWMLPLVMWPPARPGADELWVTALDVGQGSAVLIETRERAVLYDTGPRFHAQADAGGRIIAPYLRWRGIGALDLMVVSHLDSDHSGGMASLLRALPVDGVLTSIDPAHPGLRGGLRGAPVERCRAGQVLELPPLRIEVLHPSAADYEPSGRRRSTNAMSCVLRVAAAGRSVLLTGDLPAREEAELAARVGATGLRATLVTAPHHGSRHSSSAPFVAALGPAEVLVQAGYRNRFGHPAPEVLARYAAAGLPVRRTDWSGALQWRLRPDGEQLIAWRQAGRRYWHNQPGPLAPVDPDRDDGGDGGDGAAAAATDGTGYDASRREASAAVPRLPEAPAEPMLAEPAFD